MICRWFQLGLIWHAIFKFDGEVTQHDRRPMTKGLSLCRLPFAAFTSFCLNLPSQNFQQKHAKNAKGKRSSVLCDLCVLLFKSSTPEFSTEARKAREGEKKLCPSVVTKGLSLCPLRPLRPSVQIFHLRIFNRSTRRTRRGIRSSSLGVLFSLAVQPSAPSVVSPLVFIREIRS